MVVGHRHAPVGEIEAGVDCQRLLEGFAGVLEFEAVEQQHAADEWSLRLFCAGVREVDGPQLGLLRDRQG